MLEFENTVYIDRPIGEVFAFLSDFENIPKWNYYVLDIKQLSESPIGIGTTYHQGNSDGIKRAGAVRAG